MSTPAPTKPPPPAQPKARPTVSLLDRIARKLSSDAESLAEQKARQEREAYEAHKLMEHLSSRMRAVENAKARVERAKSQFEASKLQIEEFNQWILTYWGEEWERDFRQEYASLLNIKAAIDDFPRVLICLEAKLTAAQKELSEFEKKHAI